MTRTTGEAATVRRIGRPGEGETSRQEILEAAAELFSENGYAATSTRAIALAVGIKQASLYYHFASKEAMLAELLASTVQPSMDMAKALGRVEGRAVARLHALLTFDTKVLSGGKWNLGGLYLLPELRQARFASFRDDRMKLKRAYERLVRASGQEGDLSYDNARVATDLVFALGEGVILIRTDRPAGADLTDIIAALPDSGMRMLGLPTQRLATVKRESARMLEEASR